MANTNLMIGFAAAALVLGTVGAVASGIDWDPRDREASERYRHHERERADRYRSEVAGVQTPSENAAEGEEPRIARSAREEARRARRAAREEWWNGVTGRFETEGLHGVFENWGSWWREEFAPAWQEWADEQEARVGSPDRAEPRVAQPAPAELPAAVERILEESLPPEEAEAVRREAQEALDWWAEERERMRSRFTGFSGFGGRGDREDR